MKFTSLIGLGLLLAAGALVASANQLERIDAAKFDEDGNLLVPENLDEWVFIGSSLGMGYSQAEFDPDSPGMFQVARIEPEAWEYFKNTGEFADGTMIALHFYGSQSEISINRTGYVMADLHLAEIHYKDSERFPDGFNFYNLNNGEPVGREIALPNGCVDCHKRDGAYDGVFVQFYPAMHRYLPEAVRANLDTPKSGHGH